jgi:hypothetical protein
MTRIELMLVLNQRIELFAISCKRFNQRRPRNVSPVKITLTFCCCVRGAAQKRSRAHKRATIYSFAACRSSRKGLQFLSANTQKRARSRLFSRRAHGQNKNMFAPKCAQSGAENSSYHCDHSISDPERKADFAVWSFQSAV